MTVTSKHCGLFWRRATGRVRCTSNHRIGSLGHHHKLTIFLHLFQRVSEIAKWFEIKFYQRYLNFTIFVRSAQPMQTACRIEGRRRRKGRTRTDPRGVPEDGQSDNANAPSLSLSSPHKNYEERTSVKPPSLFHFPPDLGI